MKSSGVIGIIMLVVIGAIGADILAHPAGTSAASTGLNGLLTSGYKAASGTYAA